jgi:hypothetical protein
MDEALLRRERGRLNALLQAPITMALAGRRGGLAENLGESMQPVRSHRKYGVADPGGERGASGSVSIPEGSVAQQSLDATPLARCCEARVELAPWLARARSIAPFLVKYGTPAQDRGTGTLALSGGGLLDRLNRGEDSRHELLARQIFEFTGAYKRQGHNFGHRPFFAEEVLGPRSDQGFVVGDGIERGDAGPLVSPLDQSVLDWIRESVSHLGEDVVGFGKANNAGLFGGPKVLPTPT